MKDISKLAHSFANKCAGKEEIISPTEELMKQHGALNRALLIYDEVIKRLKNDEPFSIDALHSTANLIKTFIEAYHEEYLEEGIVFPVLKKAGKHIELCNLLDKQHTASQKITNAILDEKGRALISHLESFVVMYRPHEAREDTIIFPAFAALLDAKSSIELGEKFKEGEYKFAKGGYKEVIRTIENIEKELGIYDLAQYTP